MLQAFASMVALPVPEGPRWEEYGPAFESLAAAPWVRGLRSLRILSGHHSGVLGLLVERLYGRTTSQNEPKIPDAAVLALASAVSTDKLERLVLPAAIVNRSVQEELSGRFNGRVTFK